MDKFIVKGGKRLSGSLKVSGSKNAALPIMVAALLGSRGKTHLENIPNLADIHTLNGVLSGLGAKIEYDPESGVMSIDATNLESHISLYDLMLKMHATFLVLVPHL